jgi:hypothetical protein
MEVGVSCENGRSAAGSTGRIPAKKRIESLLTLPNPLFMAFSVPFPLRIFNSVFLLTVKNIHRKKEKNHSFIKDTFPGMTVPPYRSFPLGALRREF